MEPEKLLFEGIRLLGQLVVLTLIGGLISRYYAQTQKRRQIRKNVLEQFAAIHGAFISLRFKYNSLYITWEKNRGVGTHPLRELPEQKEAERWRFYQEACDLIGRFQALKPLLIAFFPKYTGPINELHQYYQTWRRAMGRGEPVLQESDGASTDNYRKMRDTYLDILVYLQRHM